jgi:predicted transglutaminase-like protease
MVQIATTIYEYRETIKRYWLRSSENIRFMFLVGLRSLRLRPKDLINPGRVLDPRKSNMAWRAYTE